MAENKDKPKSKSFRRELFQQMITLSSSGFGLVAALAWNNVIQEFVNSYIKKILPQGSGLFSLFIYAVIITILAVTITYQLTIILDKINKE